MFSFLHLVWCISQEYTRSIIKKLLVVGTDMNCLDYLRVNSTSSISMRLFEELYFSASQKIKTRTTGATLNKERSI